MHLVLVYAPYLLTATLLYMLYNEGKDYLQRRRNAALAVDTSSLRASHEQQATGLAASVNAHFIFNTLSNIQYFIESGDRGSADEHLQNFASLMERYACSSSDSDIALRDEIEIIKSYTQLAMMRYGRSFSTRISLAPEIDATKTWLPSMLIQPLIDECIEYGSPLRGHKRSALSIYFTSEGDALLCSIRVRLGDKKPEHAFHNQNLPFSISPRVESQLASIASHGRYDITLQTKENLPDTLYAESYVTIKIKPI